MNLSLKKYITLLLLFGVAFFLTKKIMYQNIQYILWHLKQLNSLGIGCCGFGFVLLNKNKPLVKNYLTFFGIKIHENCHQLAAILLGRKILGFKVNTEQDNGEIIIETIATKEVSVWILLAPYWFSYLPLFVGIFKFFIYYTGIILDVMMGLFLAFHVYLFVTQTKSYQSDLQKVGIIYSFFFIAIMHLIMINIYLFIIFSPSE